MPSPFYPPFRHTLLRCEVRMKTGGSQRGTVRYIGKSPGASVPSLQSPDSRFPSPVLSLSPRSQESLTSPKARGWAWSWTSPLASTMASERHASVPLLPPGFAHPTLCFTLPLALLTCLAPSAPSADLALLQGSRPSLLPMPAQVRWLLQAGCRHGGGLSARR